MDTREVAAVGSRPAASSATMPASPAAARHGTPPPVPPRPSIGERRREGGMDTAAEEEPPACGDSVDGESSPPGVSCPFGAVEDESSSWQPCSRPRAITTAHSPNLVPRVTSPPLPAGRHDAAAIALRRRSKSSAPSPSSSSQDAQLPAPLQTSTSVPSFSSSLNESAYQVKMGGSGLVPSSRPRANTASPRSIVRTDNSIPMDPPNTSFHYLGLLRPSSPRVAGAALPQLSHPQAPLRGIALSAPPVPPRTRPLADQGSNTSLTTSADDAPASKQTFSPTLTSIVTSKSSDDVTHYFNPLVVSAPVATTQIVGVNQLSKPTPYTWEKHKPIWKSSTEIKGSRATQRITTKMARMMLESHFGPLKGSGELDQFLSRMEKMVATYQQRWLPFGQILASTANVPFYYSGGTFPLFFRFCDLPEEDTLPSIFCTGRETLESVIQEMLRKRGQEDGRAEDKIIQFSGLAAVYAFDTSVRLKDFTYVRNALQRREKIVLLVWDRCRRPDLNPTEFLERLRPASCFEWADDEKLGLSQARKEVYLVSQLKDRFFELKLLGMENFKPATVESLTGGIRSDSCAFYVSLRLWYGGKALSPPTLSRRTSAPPVWCEWLRTNVALSVLPIEAKCKLTVHVVPLGREEPLELGAASFDLFDCNGWLVSGVFKISLSKEDDAAALLLEMERAPYPIAFAEAPHFTSTRVRGRSFTVESLPAPSAEKLIAIHNILKKNALDEPSEEDRQILWRHRSHCFAVPQSLPKLLLSVPWEDPAAVQQAHKILTNWDRLSPFAALQMLDQNYVDTVVREYAVHCLCDLTDMELVNHLLQLIQALKFERKHDSALSRFLLYRALHNRTLVGHHLFWHLKAALNGSAADERYMALIQVYIELCGEHADELFAQLEVVSKLRQLNLTVRAYKKAERTQILQNGLSTYSQFASFPQCFHLPSNPQIIATGFLVDKCKVMDSSTAPMWLCFKNKDIHCGPVQVIFKEGDDLRQDVLILQVFTEMDRLWKREGYDLHMTIYGVVSTAMNEGFIEVVTNAATCSKIQKDAAGLAGALQRTPLFNWLQKHNQTEVDIGYAVQNFVFSCAAYSVASYVLGIGDRHNDNVMITREGHIFHIDFAHILGDFMKFGAYRREKAPFVFTEEFVHVMGGVGTDQYQQFVDLSCIAFNILRNNAEILISLFVMMLPAGIPLLRTKKDIKYLESALALHLSDEEAARTFAGLVAEARACKTTRVMFFMHNLAHPD